MGRRQRKALTNITSRQVLRLQGFPYGSHLGPIAASKEISVSVFLCRPFARSVGCYCPSGVRGPARVQPFGVRCGYAVYPVSAFSMWRHRLLVRPTTKLNEERPTSIHRAGEGDRAFQKSYSCPKTRNDFDSTDAICVHPTGRLEYNQSMLTRKDNNYCAGVDKHNTLPYLTNTRSQTHDHKHAGNMPRLLRLTLLVDDKERAAISDSANIVGKSVSEFLRDAALARADEVKSTNSAREKR